MKEIWINSELYIKSYEFSIFRDFFGFLKPFFLFYFRFLNLFLINKKIKKWAWGPRGCDVALGATWQRHTDPRSAHVAHFIYVYILYIVIVNIKGYSASPIWEGSYPFKPSGLINPTVS